MIGRSAVAATLLAVSTLFGQSNPFVHQGSIGEVKKDQQTTSETVLPTLEVKDWVGQRFIFLPQPTKLRTYGYQLFEPRLSYSAWVGKIVTVTNVSEGFLPEVTFRADDGTTVRAKMYSGSINGIAPVRDLEFARSRWLGKTLWIRGNELGTWNEQTDEFGSVKVRKCSPVEVQDVVAAFFDHEPVRLILKTPDGRVGFYDLALSGTNVSPILRKFAHFDDAFFERDPHTTYTWPKNVWDAIENGKVFIGMSADQATLSWGKPKEVNRTVTARGAEEQWVYGDSNFLYVNNGKVTAVQN